MTYKVGPKGQVVIPKEIRERLGIAPGDEVDIDDADGEIRVRKVDDDETLFGSLPPAELDPLDVLLAERRWERALEEKRIEEWNVRESWRPSSSTPGPSSPS